LSLQHEIETLFSPAVVRQAQNIKPETVDALAVHEAVGALLLLKGKSEEQTNYVSQMKFSTAVALCRWMSDPSFWGKVGSIEKH
jgi:hypothetical protein